jgi:hypothetical protein
MLPGALREVFVSSPTPGDLDGSSAPNKGQVTRAITPQLFFHRFFTELWIPRRDLAPEITPEDPQETVLTTCCGEHYKGSTFLHEA